MPIEQVRCDNCGSGDVRQLVADSYACEHCHTNFRWVDPTKRTVVHESRFCECGKVPTAVCYGCRQPVCGQHGRPWLYRDSNYEFDRADYDTLKDFEFPVRQQLEGPYPEPVRQAVINVGLPDPNARVILCRKCWCESCTALKPVLEALGHLVSQEQARQQASHQARLQLVLQGKACWKHDCSATVHGRCAICKAGFCSQHVMVCPKCNQTVGLCHMGKHKVTGEGGPMLCEACTTAAETAAAKGAGCAGVLLAFILTCAVAGVISLSSAAPYLSTIASMLRSRDCSQVELPANMEGSSHVQ